MTVAAVSLGFAITMAGCLVALLIRRRHQERRIVARTRERTSATRALIRMIASDERESLKHGIPLEAWRAAVSHLLRLVRGKDRARLLELAERQGLFDDAVAALLDPRQARRIDAIRSVEQYGSPTCIAGLGVCLRADPVMAVRLEAAAALARLTALPPVNDLVLALRMDEFPVTRLHAALFRSLAERDAELVAKLASSPHYCALRPLLVEAMGWTCDLTMVPQLAEHASDFNPEVRCAAIRAARHIGHPRSGEWIVSLLDDPEEAVRVQAAQACGHLRLKNSVAALERLATESSWWVRTRARGALEILRPAGGPALISVKPSS